MSVIDRIKQAASGKWESILSLDIKHTEPSKGQPCPMCAGEDRFHVDKEFATYGIVYCRQCLDKGSGDGIGSYAWSKKIENSQAIKELASLLGISAERDDSPKLDLIELVCRDKKMPRAAFEQFGPKLDKRGKLEVVRIPVWNAKCEQHSYFDLWPKDKGKFRRGEGSQGLFLPSRKPQPGEKWLLVEGVKDAAALIGLGYPNVCGLPTNSMGVAYAELFRGCEIVVVPDNDKAGHYGANKTGGVLIGIAQSVKVARLPGEVVDSKGEDVRDVLRQRGPEAVRAAIDSACDWIPRESEQNKDERPEVLLLLNEGLVAQQCVKHIGSVGFESNWLPSHIRERSKVYCRGGSLVHVVPSEDPSTLGKLTIALLPKSIVRERLTQACQLIIEGVDKDGNVVTKPERPPNWLVNAISERGHYSGCVRPLVSIVQTPTLRSNGSILQTPGYDTESGLLYVPNAEYPKIESEPTKDDAIRAFHSIMECIADFPFVSESDKTAWFAMLLSLIARNSVDGCVPMIVVTATQAGSGKGLSVDVATLIAFGHSVSKKGFPIKQEELTKQITSLLIEGAPVHVFDNVDVTLRGAELDAVLTATTWKDRILSTSKTTGDIPATCVWLATGNNVQFGSDTARRVLPIRLEPAVESPESRTDFSKPNLLEWVKANRPRLVADALTFVRAFFVAGCPKVDAVTWGSFESWAAIIRGSIIWAGLADPMKTRESVAESDETKELVLRMITAIEQADPNGSGKTVREFADIIQKFPDQVPLLCDVATEICQGPFIAKRFSKRLVSMKGRIVNQKRIISENAGGGIKRWKVTGGWFGGFGGFENNQATREEENQPALSVCDANACTESPWLKTNQPNQPNQPREEFNFENDEVLF